MALLQLRLRSSVLRTRTEVQLVLPIDNPDFTEQSRMPKYQHVYMLHGGAVDSSVWLRDTSAERYARERNVALIFPDGGGHSYYTDCVYGRDYWTYLTEELPVCLNAMFRCLSEQRADRFVAGFSMGGYGAFKCACLYPERFAAAAGLSGGYDLKRILEDGLSSVPDKARRAIFGDPPLYDPDTTDLYVMLKKLKAAGVDIPLLYSNCGTEDPLTWQCHVHMKAFCEENGIPLTARSGPGLHNFAFWDAATADMLDWLPLRRKPIFGD